MELNKGNQKLQKMEIGEDRFSLLPDCLIHHILSFLDMVYVVRTATLSTRWRYLWTSVPTLNFNSDEFYESIEKKSLTGEQAGFNKFVGDVLLLHDNSDIQTFSLNNINSDGELLPGLLGSWICVLVQHNVQELDLDLYLRIIPENIFEVPDCLFTCKSLIKLRLSIDSVSPPLLYLPDSISLPKTKTIHLQSVSFEDDDLTSMLFSSCPALHTLILEDCELDNLTELVIEAPTIQHLAIYSPDVPGSVNFYINYDENGVAEGTKIKIYTPDLRSFVFHETIHIECYLDSGSFLEKANVSFATDYFNWDNVEAAELAAKKEAYAKRLRQIFKGISMVKDLVVSGTLLEFVSVPPVISEVLPMQLCNLKYLKLGECLSKESIHGIMYFLQISPVLETLILEKYCCCNKDIWNPYCDEDNPDPGYVKEYREVLLSSQCMFKHLKSVEMHNVEGCVNELKFLEILLGAALVLEKIRVFTAKWISLRMKRRIEANCMQYD